MYNIDKDEILSKVSEYALFRNGKKVLIIEVHEQIAGKTDFKFMAAPKRGLIAGEVEYYGHGNSEDEALKDCLPRIKGVSLDAIAPRSHSD